MASGSRSRATDPDRRPRRRSPGSEAYLHRAKTQPFGEARANSPRRMIQFQRPCANTIRGSGPRGRFHLRKAPAAELKTVPGTPGYQAVLPGAGSWLYPLRRVTSRTGEWATCPWTYSNFAKRGQQGACRDRNFGIASMALWALRTYVNTRGQDVVKDWYDSQSTRVQAAFGVRLEYLLQRPVHEWKEPYFSLLRGPCLGLGEVRFLAEKRQYRPIGFLDRPD